MIFMKLYYDRRSKNPTYFIEQGIRNGKKTTTRNIKTIGKHNDLLKITDDPLEYAKQEVAKFNEEYKANKISIDVNIDFSKSFLLQRMLLLIQKMSILAISLSNLSIMI